MIMFHGRPAPSSSFKRIVDVRIRHQNLHCLIDAGTVAFFQLLCAELAPVLALPVPSKELIIIIIFSADEDNNANH